MAAAKGNKYTLKRKIHPQYTEKQIEALAEDLIEWADTAKDIHIAGWSRKHKKTTSWLHELCTTYPVLKAAKDEAMILLGKKVLNSSFYGTGNATVGLAYLPIYDKDFKALLEWKAQIAKEIPSREESKSAISQYIEEMKK